MFFASEQELPADALVFFQPEQHVTVIDFPIWFADRLKLELSGCLKGLDAFSRYHRCAGIVSIR